MYGLLHVCVVPGMGGARVWVVPRAPAAAHAVHVAQWRPCTCYGSGAAGRHRRQVSGGQLPQSENTYFLVHS